MPMVQSPSDTTGGHAVLISLTELNTIVDHLRCRPSLKVGEVIGDCQTAITNWETNRSVPGISYMPANELAEELVRQRTALGLSQKQAAEHIGVDPSTLARKPVASGSNTSAFIRLVLLFPWLRSPWYRLGPPRRHPGRHDRRRLAERKPHSLGKFQGKSRSRASSAPSTRFAIAPSSG